MAVLWTPELDDSGWYTSLMRLGHIGIPVKDLAASKRFYDAIAPYVGLKLIDAHDNFVGYGENGSYEIYVHTMRAPTSGVHVCFQVDTREQVTSFYDSALAAGGTDNGAPDIRKDYSPTYYAAFVLDPDGNNIEALCRN